MNRIITHITADNTQFIQKINQSKAATKSMAASGVSQLKSMAISYLGVTAAVTALVSIVKSSSRAYNKQMKVENQLQAVLKSTGNAAGLTAEEIKNMASGLQSVTTYGDEAIIGAQNLLLTFTNIGKEVFPEATETVLNMSEALGQDLKSSSIQLGKALNDPIKGITALSRVGVSFTEQQKSMIKTMANTGDIIGAQKIILAELTKEFGGSARQAANTYEGQMKQLGNTLGDMGENIFSKLVPGLTDLGQALAGSAKSGNIFIRVLSGMARAVGVVAKGYANLLDLMSAARNKDSLDENKNIVEESEREMLAIKEKYAEKGIKITASNIKSLLMEKKVRHSDYVVFKDELDKKFEAQSKITDAAMDQVEISKRVHGEEEEIKEVSLKSTVTKEAQKQNAIKRTGRVRQEEKEKAITSAVKLYEMTGQFEKAAIEKLKKEYEGVNLDTWAAAEFSVKLQEALTDRLLVYKLQAIEKERAAREASNRAQLGMDTAYYNGAKMLLQRGAILMQSSNKKLFRVGQALAVGRTFMNSAEAIIKGFTYGPFIGIPYAALVGTETALAVSMIKKQKPPEMANGGFQPGSAQGTLIKMSEGGRGEAIVPLENPEVMDKFREALGGTNIQVNIDGENLFNIVDNRREQRASRMGASNYSKRSVYK